MKKMIMMFLMMVGLMAHASSADYNVRDYGAKGDGKRRSTTKPSMLP